MGIDMNIQTRHTDSIVDLGAVIEVTHGKPGPGNEAGIPPNEFFQ
jgi:hypothetical protein